MIIATKNMHIKFYNNRLESILKQKYPEIPTEIYYSRRRKLVHLALDKSIEQYQNYNDLLKNVFMKYTLGKILNFVNL